MDGSYDTMEQSNPMLREFVLHPGSAELMSQSSINSSDDPMQKSLNIKDLETAMDNLKKENFSLKLRIFYLQERLAKMGPANLETILNENIEFNVKIKELQNEIAEKTRLLVQAREAIEALQAESDLNNQRREKCDACFADLEKSHALASKWEKRATELQQQLQAMQKTAQEQELRAHMLEQINAELNQKIAQHQSEKKIAADNKELEESRACLRDLKQSLAMEQSKAQEKIQTLERRVSKDKQLIEELERNLVKAQRDLSVARNERTHNLNASDKIAELESQLQRKATELEQKTHAHDLEKHQLDILLQHKTRELEERETHYDRTSRELEARLFKREKLAVDLQQRVEQCERMITQREQYTADELANLHETVVRLRTELLLDNENAELQESRLQLEVKTADCAILAAQLEACNHQLTQKNYTLHEALEALENLETENASLNVQATSARHTCEQLSAELANLSHECEALRDAIDARDRESTELRELVRVKEHELATINELVDTTNTDNDELRTQLVELSRANESLRIELANPSRSQIYSLLNSSQESTSQLEDKSREASRLRVQLKARTDECARASEQVDSLGRENTALYVRLDTLKHETARLTLQLEDTYALQGEVDSLKREKARLLSQLGGKSTSYQPSELEHLQSILDSQARENTRLNSKIAEFSEENTRVSSLNSEYAREVSRIRAQLEVAIKAQSKANDFVHEMQLKVDSLMRDKASIQLQLDRFLEDSHQGILGHGRSSLYEQEHSLVYDGNPPTAILEADLLAIRAELGTRTLENSLLHSQADERSQHSTLLRSQLEDSTRLNAQLRNRVEEQAAQIRSQIVTLTNLHNDIADCAAIAAHSQEISLAVVMM